MTINFQQVLEQERAMQAAINNVIEEICGMIYTDICTHPLDGVRTISTSPQVAVVKLGTLNALKNWAPETYIPQAQAAAVEKKLRTCKSAADLLDTVGKMIAEKRIRSSTGDLIQLNPKTVQILSEMQQKLV